MSNKLTRERALQIASKAERRAEEHRLGTCCCKGIECMDRFQSCLDAAKYYAEYAESLDEQAQG